MSKGTALALDVYEHHRTYTVGAGTPYHIGPWTVKSFNLEHDAADPVGFLIAHGDDRLLFIPDTAYVEQRFEGVTIIAIECNHIGDLLSDNIINGSIPAIVGKRVRRNHMGLEQVISMLKANDLSKCRKICLLHLSDANSDERRMVREVQEATGIPTEAAS